MATVNLIKSKRSQTRAGLAFILSYCKRESKTVHDGKKLVSGINCVADSAYHEMMSTKMQYGKTDGRMFYHLVQSFSPDENITPETAHEIALNFAEEQFADFEVLVATHTDKAHIHSHFVINSVSQENGYKLRPQKDFIEHLRNASDRLCLEYGLSVIKPQRKSPKTKQMSSREYRSAVRGESYKMRLAAVIDDAMATAKSKEEFINLMEAEGYGVRWTSERKYITYTTPEGNKCRDIKLHEEKYLKGNMENEFGIREIIRRAVESESKTEYAESSRSEAVYRCYRTKLERDARYTADADRYADGTVKDGRYADYQRGTDRLYESAVEYSEREQHGMSGSGDGISNADGNFGSELFTVDAEGSIGYRETGWENERELFEQSLYDEGYDAELSETDILDYGYPVSNNGGLLSDTAYLAADLTNIIDEDASVEDCTTKRFPTGHKKKQSGPVMGGM